MKEFTHPARVVIAAVAVCAALTSAVRADDVAEMPARYSNSMVVTAAKPASTEDERLETQVLSALAGDPYLFIGHMSVTVKNRVATLHGFVFDDWDLRNSLRVARQVPGVKRVLNDLEITVGGE
jgi:osmotically-inducible protein OsmY